MSPGEALVALASSIVALVGWSRWYARLGRRGLPGRRRGVGRVLAAVPLLAMAGVLAVLRGLASADVREDLTYLLFYAVLGAAWLVLARSGAGRLGLSWIDDAVERGNPAAVAALSGALIGAAACYAGGNIGDGPGWWCVAVAAGLATALWFFLWFALERLAAVSEAITVERDRGAGLRVGAWLAASGLICGRAAAGDWIDLGSTVRDFALAAWPALPLAAGAALVELKRARRPVAAGPSAVSEGWVLPSIVLAAAYVAAALAVVLLLRGSPENPLYGLPPAEAL